jgi:2-amino-4-hydroxy-6-hydroxymethyldihydropteridine diphosphokinase
MSRLSSNVRREEQLTRSILSLGSNLGEREWNILSAVRLAAMEPGIRIAALSPLYESEPVGEGYSGTFVNAAAALDTSLDPPGLLAACARIESAMGRARSDAGNDRAIDLDIIVYGEIVMKSPGLTLPHPRAGERLFVLRPAADIAPGLRLEPGGPTVEDLVAAGAARGWVRKISSRIVIPSNFLNLKDLD